MKQLVVLFVLMYSTAAFAQQQKERRVYYLDCSYSMKTLGLWDSVRENLKNAIDGVSDGTTELIVIPFTDRRTSHYPLPVYSELATEAGKSHLKSRIDGLTCDKRCNTVHYVPLQDFYTNRIAPDGITYMFLMTDGQNELEIDEFNNGLRQWGEKFADRDVYGFYVMLDKSAKNPTVESLISKQPHLWKVETADINIRLIRFETKAVFNIRNEQHIDIPLYGDTSGIKFSAECNDADYKVAGCQTAPNSLRIFIHSEKDTSLLPTSKIVQLKVGATPLNDFTILVTNQVEVKCKNEKEYTLKVSIK